MDWFCGIEIRILKDI